MIILKVQGARRSTLAIHQLESYADVRDLLAVYEALGHNPEMLIVEDRLEEQAA